MRESFYLIDIQKEYSPNSLLAISVGQGALITVVK